MLQTHWWTRIGVGSMFCAVLLTSQFAHGLEKFRFYRMGEDDGAVKAGDLAVITSDSQPSPNYKNNGQPLGTTAPGTGGDQFGNGGYQEFVDLDTFSGAAGTEPKYISPGRPLYDKTTQTFSIYNPSSLAIEFDGIDDVMTAVRVDSRDFGGFTNWSQAWVRPDSTGAGRKQWIWSNGFENGGVGISADGHWMMLDGSENVAAPPATGTDFSQVPFDTWSHVLVRRTGNFTELYVNGNIVASHQQQWGGVATMTMGNRTGGGPETSFDGAIDDWNVAAYSKILVPQVDFSRDNDYLAEIVKSGRAGAADFNIDGIVDNLDYSIWSANALTNNGIGTGGFADTKIGDADGNGRINFFDLAILRSQLTAGDAGPVAVPEPATGGLAMMSLVAGFVLTRRVRRA